MGQRLQAAPSPHFVELELVGGVGGLLPVVSRVQAAQEGVRGQQVAGGREEEDQTAARPCVSPGHLLTGCDEPHGLGFETTTPFP